MPPGRHPASVTGAPLSLSVAIGNYGLTRALKSGAVKAKGLDLEFVEVEPITAAMRRMARGLEFDICEMAFTTYLCARAVGKKLTAIPVFLTRNFHHWAAFHNVNSGIRAPKDLEGRKVACNRGYTVTTNLWVRGILQHEYGVDLDSIAWLPTDEEHVAEYQAPANVDYAKRGRRMEDMLLKDGIGAALGDVRVDSPDIKPLIPDARQAGFAYYRKTGIYPMNHGVVMKESLLRERPEVARALFDAFTAAKAEYRAHLAAGKDLTPADKTALELGAVVGDPFPFGVAANGKALEAMVQFAAEQQITRRRMSVAELFAPDTLDLA